MPGANCCVVGCGTNRRHKVLVCSSYRLKNYIRLQVITKYREKDKHFKQQIENDTVHVCELHCSPVDIEICKQNPISLACSDLRLDNKTIDSIFGSNVNIPTI